MAVDSAQWEATRLKKTLGIVLLGTWLGPQILAASSSAQDSGGGTVILTGLLALAIGIFNLWWPGGGVSRSE
ncbi:MAG: hypothetical protein IT442_12580 [Phycisphaeraceae bacterium]|nr:hypothetical protein [Phycisphaeraceae bacterium]